MFYKQPPENSFYKSNFTFQSISGIIIGLTIKVVVCYPFFDRHYTYIQFTQSSYTKSKSFNVHLIKKAFLNQIKIKSLNFYFKSKHTTKNESQGWLYKIALKSCFAIPSLFLLGWHPIRALFFSQPITTLYLSKSIFSPN